MAAMAEPNDIVRDGYDRLVDAYLQNRGEYDTSGWLERFASRIKPGGRILDLGCGAGVPIAKALAGKGFQVTGLDISPGQVARARELVPSGTFEVIDMTRADFPSDSFDGVCALYSIIHVPRDRHAGLYESIRRWLKPDGVALLVLGAQEWEGEEEYLEGVPMVWSHFGIEENRRLLNGAGLAVIEEGIVPDPPGAHWFVIVLPVAP